LNIKEQKTKEQKQEGVKKAKQLLKLYPYFSKNRFADFITGDETWVHYFEPKRKSANRVWATKHARRPVKAKRSITLKKVLYCICFTNNVPEIQIPVPKGKSVTSKVYKNVVLKKLQKYLYKRRPKHGLKYVSLLHNNASSHKAQIVIDFLKQQNVRVLPHPAYSPDLAPCDYFLFPRLKSILAGKRYASRKAFGSAVCHCLRERVSEIYCLICYKNLLKTQLCKLYGYTESVNMGIGPS